MPSRLLREGILSSDRIEMLDWPSEVFYRRLMSKVDDFGLFDARPSILRSSLYPLRVDRVREADIARWIAACETAGVIALYVHGGKPYGQMLDTGWQTRSEPKHPLPPWGTSPPLQTTENSGEQEKATVPVFGVVVGDVEKKGARKRAPGFDANEIELPDWLDRELWATWVQDRKARKKPVTEAGARAQLKQLDEYRRQGASPEKVIQHSIAGGYQGLFAPANGRAQPTTGNGASTVAQTKEYLAKQSMTAEEKALADAARVTALASRMTRTAA